MKIILTVAIVFGFISSTIAGIQHIINHDVTLNKKASLVDQVYYYNQDGSKNWWNVEKDIFTFRCANGMKFKGNINLDLIDSIEYAPFTQRQQTTIKFKVTTTEQQRTNEINKIIQSSEFEYMAYNVTKSRLSKAAYTQQERAKTSDLLIVNFKEDIMKQDALDSFINRCGLIIYHRPSNNLPPANWTYIFRINPLRWSNTFDASRIIFESERNFISRCIPDMQRGTPDGCETVTELDDFSRTFIPDALWHIRNRGNNISSGQSGQVNADADICECWGEGYQGKDIKIAVMDYGGFDYNHPDMKGQFLKGWKLTEEPISSHSTSFWNEKNPIDHAMAVSGIIAAKANSTPINTAVGVAYNSKIIPLLVDGASNQSIIGIQKAIEEGADVINICYGFNSSSRTQSYFYNSVENARKVGRNGLGTIVVASTGNHNEDIRHFPAAETNVFGVGATDPNDFRASYTQTVPWSWKVTSAQKGSNFLTPSAGEKDTARYNVVAPGTRIVTVRTKDPLGSPEHQYIAFTGTSAAVPVTSGIIALMLSKNPYLTVQEIEDILMSTANRIQPTTYNYNSYSFIPGYNEETFFGRINCLSALNNLTTNLKVVQKKQESPYRIVFLNKNEIGVFFENNTNPQGCSISIYNLSGMQVASSKILPRQQSSIINTAVLPSGFYFLNLVDHHSQLNQIEKIWVFK